MARTALPKGKELAEALDTLLDELDEACQEVQRLIRKRHLSSLEGEVKLSLLGDLFGAVSHLHIHSKALPDLISREMDEVEAKEVEEMKTTHAKGKALRVNGTLKRKVEG